MTTNTQVIFSKIPTSMPVIGEHLTLRKSTIDLDAPLADGEFLVKLLSLSIDPYMRLRMREAHIESYISAFELDKPLINFTISVCLKSNNPKFKEGDIVETFGPFEEYTVVTPEQAGGYTVLKDAKESGLPLSNYLGALGLAGFTAYVGLFKYGNPKAGETMYVSSASGGVGQCAGQIGKILGLRVVGSAGTDEKVAYLKEIGYDAAFNYRTEDIDAKLTEYCPNGIDIDFENVGGKMLDIVIEHMNTFGRIVGCGMISQYNREKHEGIHNIFQIVTKSIRMEGFIVSNSPEMHEAFRKDVSKWLQEGKMKYKETVLEGIEKTPEAILDIFNGKNFGKLYVKVADL
ncbi:hypothetical protein BJV82DRAFT_562704 [Fennellomyces sp. T-0311]|nr:hypothetical protein BJV82DRAFT_562704 [Fennellomyces sp. T-0311]